MINIMKTEMIKQKKVTEQMKNYIIISFKNNN